MSARIALYGGTFDPIHVGHLITARSVAEQLDVERVIFVPSASPPHKLDVPITPAEHRLEMVRLAIDGEPGFEVSDCEIRRTGPSYTFDTIMNFRRTVSADAMVYWFIGADSLAELASWHRIAELVRQCRIITASRPGFEQPDLSTLGARLTTDDLASIRDGILTTPRIDVAATEIRRRVGEGVSIRFLVPESVREYVHDRCLYQS